MRRSGEAMGDLPFGEQHFRTQPPFLIARLVEYQMPDGLCRASPYRGPSRAQFLPRSLARFRRLTRLCHEPNRCFAAIDDRRMGFGFATLMRIHLQEHPLPADGFAGTAMLVAINRPSQRDQQFAALFEVEIVPWHLWMIASR